MKKRLVIANWKMYVQTPSEAKKLFSGLGRKSAAWRGVEVWYAVPAPFLPLLPKGKLGGQAISTMQSGAHTGNISAAMLKGAGATFCLVGHSECRAAGDSLEAVHTQLKAIGEAGLSPVLCVGEQARSSEGSHFSEIEEQLRSALRGAAAYTSKLVVAYEPVWAIGKSAREAMQPDEVEEMVIFIRKVLVEVLGRTDALKVPILYGGSVEGENAQALIATEALSGLLVGHASVEVSSFTAILTACKRGK